MGKRKSLQISKQTEIKFGCIPKLYFLKGRIKMHPINEICTIFSKFDTVDLTYPLEEGMPAWPTQARYSSTIYESYEYGAEAIHSRITLSEHSGTHMDAPKHFFPGAISIDQVSPNLFFGRGVKIDMLDKGNRQLVYLSELLEFEKENGEILEGDIVFFRFGWDMKYGLRENSIEYLKEWPGLSLEVAQYLLDKKVNCVGCDTLALDAYESKNVSHHILLGNGIPILENVANLSELPIFSYIVVLPLKIKGGSGAPVRCIGLVEKSKR